MCFKWIVLFSYIYFLQPLSYPLHNTSTFFYPVLFLSRLDLYSTISSSHLVFGLACFLLPCSGIHSVTLLVHLLSLVLAMWPAHCHLRSLILIIMSCNPVCCLIYGLLFLSLLDIPIIVLSVLIPSLGDAQSFLHSLCYCPCLTAIC